MKTCPICGAPVRVRVGVLCYQDDSGWHIEGDLEDLCSYGLNEAVCSNTDNCGDVTVYNDQEHMHPVATIRADPQYGFVTVEQLRAYYDSMVEFKIESDESDDKSFEFWRRHYIECMPWSGIVADTVDV